MWGLSDRDDNAAINGYKAEYGITNPCAGTDGGGPDALDVTILGQNFIGFPTYCIICVDRTMYFDACWPPTAACFDPFFDDCAAIVSVEDPTIPAERLNVTRIYPNPANNVVTIEIISGEDQEVTLEIFNLLGKNVNTTQQLLSIGTHELKMDISDLPNGSYFLVLSQNKVKIQVHKVAVIR